MYGTLVPQYLPLFVTFGMSELIHHTSDIATGMNFVDAGSVKFFLLQPLGFILEDGAQAVARKLMVPQLRHRILDYFWIALSLTWCTPTWLYPQQRLVPDAAGFLPFCFGLDCLSAFLTAGDECSRKGCLGVIIMYYQPLTQGRASRKWF